MDQIKLSLIIFSLCTTQLILRAQDISGKVIDIRGEPIAYANVVLLSANDSTYIYGTITDMNGQFFITSHESDQYILKISFIGYGSEFIKSNKKNNNIITLKESALELDEVVIVSNRPVFKNINGSIITNVSNTILSKEHSMVSLLTQIPGIINIKGNIEVFGSGSPIYYINNKKVYSIDEVSNLNVEDIKSIELVTNPGSRYDATAKAVIKIVTLKKDDELSLQWRARALQSEHFSHNENFTITYKKNRLSSSLYYNFYDYKGESTQEMIKEVQNDTVWQYITDRFRLPKSHRHNYRLNFDFEFTPENIFGMQFNGAYSKSREKTNENNAVVRDNSDYLYFKSNSELETKINNHQLNIFHYYRWNRKLIANINLDYVRYTDPRKQLVQEVYSNNKITTDMSGDGKVNIYAGEYILEYKVNGKSNITGGINYSIVRGNGVLETESSHIDIHEYRNKENKFASFIDYDLKIDNYSFNVGMRYEDVNSKYNDLYNNKNNINRLYQRIFPSLKLSHMSNSLSSTLSFTSRTERPPLSFLNGQTYYQNQFMYQVGNPKLIPQTSYIVEWMTGYKNVNFQTSYSKIYDYISPIYKEDPINNSIVISTWENFDKAEFLKTTLNYRNTFFKIWSPSTTLGVIKPFFKNKYLDNTIYYNQLTLYISFNNYFRLPSDYILSLSYYYNSGGAERIYVSEPFHTVNMGIQKSLFEDRISINIRANDLFRSLKYEQIARINNFRFHQKEQYSEWNFSVDIIYRINQQKAKYRGKSAAESEINRLN
ncbi:MAG: outer membrane beta-barrel protein [Proteiniphilum sp.]|jgi:hypothetical protein|uniref:TonB-dependent receptor domain-containing protein n=1 Tax=Proteiniphilum sp. TaxID=1926877 RepID=UPI002B1F5961|nr:TonB-dependent receptor [Proteiniphilum sp.]MEA5062104.1 outer membrane beta-barrel protein [Petrimonas sp.]MEA5128979.1 outer membrane beta-barrel protein [Proteiniphilum sp.]